MRCCHGVAPLQPAQWGGSLDEQYRRLGGQLISLTELEVWGSQEPLLCAVSAVVSSAPNLTCLTLFVTSDAPHMELPAICSASLESITVHVNMYAEEEGGLLQPVVLTFLPGCTRLRQVLVQFDEEPTEGTVVNIRCHSASPTRIVPLGVHASQTGNVRTHVYDGCFCEVGVQFLPGPPPPQGVQSYSIVYACHAAGPQQPLMWGHVVVPGIL